ncbi:MAG: beta-propeller fold lactonase family protein [Acidimicrobiales bacterium]
MGSTGDRPGATAGRRPATAVLAMVVASTLAVAIGASPAYAAPGRAYVANTVSDTVSVVDTATNTVVATIPVGDQPNALAVRPDGTRVYVANGGSDTVSVIDTATNTVVATIPVGNFPQGVAVRPDGARVYVATFDGLAVIDPATNSVVATIPVVAGAGMAFSPDGRRMYVANQALDALTVVDTTTNTVVTDIPVGHSPHGVAVRPDGARVYVTNQSSLSVSVIDTATNAVVATLPVPRDPTGVALSPDGSRLYVASLSGAVTVIDTATNAVVATVPVPFAREVAVAPSGDRVYVTRDADGQLAVLDTATNTVVANVPVGRSPHGVAVTAAPASSGPVIAGSTWFSDGTRARPAGSTVTARATGAFPNVPYRLVLATGGCRDVVAVLNPASLWPGTNGRIGNVQGTVPATTAPGVYEVCFRDLSGMTATGVATFTVT